LRVDVEMIGAIIADRRVRGVTFTGSTKAGRIVAEHAGRALKKSVLELGGNDAYIVCDDADRDQALEACIAARCVNNGQSCIAGKRFYVHESLYPWFVTAMADRFDAMVVGDPRDPQTEIGPLARRDLRDGVVDQVRRAIADGARMVTQRPVNDVPAQGWFMRPVVLADLPETSSVADEEIFGPVAVVRPFATIDEVVARVNASSYGLGGGIFSRDLDRARAIAVRLDTGMVAINDMLRSDPRLPFGGVKDSGYGRELGHAGLREFTSVKVIR
jgi:succinate-semialdehyde dehydrogenase/glutarate-semialdehyde dehydrogenase